MGLPLKESGCGIAMRHSTAVGAASFQGRLVAESQEFKMRLPATILVTATSGLLWGGLAHSLEVAPSLSQALFVGTTTGVLLGFVIKPLRDVEWPATAALSLLGLYVAVILFAIGYSVGWLATIGRPLARWPSTIAGAGWSFVVGLSFSGWLLLLWPLSFANHLLVWWCQRRNEPSAS